MRAEVLRQLAAVRFLHDKNDVGPFDLLRRQLRRGTSVEASRIGFHSGPRREHLLGRGAAELVCAANKKNVGHEVRLPDKPFLATHKGPVGLGPTSIIASCNWRFALSDIEGTIRARY